MTTTKNSKTAAPLAEYATKALTPTMQDYVAWLTEQTGYKVDPQTVAIASALRVQFQKSEGNQARLAEAKVRAAEEAAAKAARKAEREAGAKERAAKKAAREAARIERARAIIAAADAAAATKAVSK